MTDKITTNITVDDAYEAVAPDDFGAMMEVDRYGKRSTAFDKIISATSTSPSPSTWRTSI